MKRGAIGARRATHDDYSAAFAKWLEMARRAIGEKEPNRAARASVRAMVLAPGHQDGLRSAALSAMRLGLHSASIRLIRRIHLIDRREQKFLGPLGECYLRLSNGARARNVARRMLVFDPTSPQGQQIFGRSLSVTGDKEGTMKAFERMQCSTGGDGRIFLALARASFSVDRFEKALGWIDKAIGVAERSAETLLLRGRILRMLGRVDEAAAAFDAAVAIDPSFAEKRRLAELTLVEADFRLSGSA